jgi:hypothetical protein
MEKYSHVDSMTTDSWDKMTSEAEMLLYWLKDLRINL